MKEINTDNSRKKKSYFKTGKRLKRQQVRRDEAEERSKKHSGHFGTKEKVKRGIITPCEGLAVVPNNTKTGAWLEKQKKKIGCK